MDEIRLVNELGSYIKMVEHGAIGQTYVQMSGWEDDKMGWYCWCE